MEHKNLTKIIVGILVPVLVAAASFWGVAPYTTDPDHHQTSIQALEEKENTVLELTTASTAASLVASALPGDMGTPVANKLTDLSTGFLAVLCVLYLEKYLLTVTGLAAFKILIPLACALYVLHTFVGKESLVKIARKMILFALVVYLIVPTSIATSHIIEDTYQASIQETLDTAKDLSEDMEEQTAVDSGTKKPWYESVGDWANGVKDKVGGTVTGWLDKAERAANGILEALAVMLVTCCLIPLLVILAFVWIFKLIFSVDIPVVNLESFRRSRKKGAAHVSPSDH